MFKATETLLPENSYHLMPKQMIHHCKWNVFVLRILSFVFYRQQADLINQLYQGKLKDYVRCLECGYESWRIDTYLDIPLVIRPFGASQAYGSVVSFSSLFL